MSETTVMVRNIPNRYDQALFLNELKILGFEGKYDMAYLLTDFESKSNLGYAYINFCHPIYILEFYQCMQGKPWIKFKSSKICNLVYAKRQGFLEHYRYFKKKIGNAEELPVSFKPLFIHAQHKSYIAIPLIFYQAFKYLYPTHKIKFHSSTFIIYDNLK
jgi:hypothetical protein